MKHGWMALLPGLLFASPRIEPDNSSALTVRGAGQQLQLETLVRGFDHPWGMAWLQDGGLIISERNGTLWLWDKQQLSPLSPPTDDVFQQGQGGWLDVAVDANDRVYLSYARKISGGSATTLARFRITGRAGAYRITEWTVLFTAIPAQNSQIHFGGAMALAGETLYLSLGERGNRKQAQNPASHLGSIVHLTLDGAPTAPRPFADPGGLPELFSIGHRNVQGLVWLTEQQVLLASEHGPRGGDEVNLIQPGANYGWPVISHGREYRNNAIIGEGGFKEGMEQPLQYWTPSPAFAGTAYYTAQQSAKGIKPWGNSLLVASLAAKSLYVLPLSPQADRLLAQGQEKITLPWRLRQVKVGDDGSVYLLSDESDGRLLRLRPS